MTTAWNPAAWSAEEEKSNICEVCGADSSKGVCYGCAVVWNTLTEIASVNPEALDSFIKTRKEETNG